jgi:CRP-like cAMP-binding protein
MADLKTIQEEMRERLREIESLIEALRGEAQQIKKMLGGTVDGAAVEPAQRPRRAARRKASPDRNASAAVNRGRPRGSGKRAQDALERIAAQPGVTAAELAEAMGIKPNYLYRVLPALQKEGKITKQGKGYHPSGGAASPVP